MSCRAFMIAAFVALATKGSSGAAQPTDLGTVRDWLIASFTTPAVAGPTHEVFWNVAAAKGAKARAEDVPSEFAYTKTTKYRRFMLLVRAAEKGRARDVRALLRSGVEVNGRDVGDDVAPTNRPLAVAAERGHLDVVNVLLAAGASPDWCCCSCVTALHYAIEGKHVPIVRRLLDAGANPTIPYDGRMSTLDLARRVGDPEIVRMVKERLSRP